MPIDKIKFDAYTVLKSILEITDPHVGEDFLTVCTHEIKKLFEADIVLITRAINFNPTTKVKVLACTQENFPSEFLLDGTPCQLVYEDEIIEITQDVNQNFEQEKETDFQSFFGIPIHNEKGVCIGHIAICSNCIRKMDDEFYDIALILARRIETEFKRLNLENENDKIKQQLEKLAITDELTRLYNRRHFNKICSDIFAQVKRHSITATLSFIDIDDFKHINDRYGHDVGDNVLKKLSKIFCDNSREGTDIIARIGGDEFAIISTNTNINLAYEHIMRIQEQIHKTFIHEPYDITISVGISQFDDCFKSWDDGLKEADENMYQAKEIGKNRVVY